MSTPAPLPELQLQNHTWTVDYWTIEAMRGEFDLTAPYQRDDVWTIEKRQSLIRSLLMGLPIGSITYADLGRDHAPGYRIVDGKQRITTLRMFIDDEFSVPGHWFRADHLLDGEAGRNMPATFSDLSRYGQRHLKGRQLPGLEFRSCTQVTEKPDGFGTGTDRFNFRKRTPDEMLQAEAELYLLVNFGGVAQTDDDQTRARKVAGR